MRDFLAECDPGHNPQFQRRWVDDPLDLPEFQCVGREVVSQVAEGAGRRAIACWLNKTSQTRGQESTRAFQQADHIRRQLGLAWGEMIDAPRTA